jgi:hypothetical protein
MLIVRLLVLVISTAITYAIAQGTNQAAAAALIAFVPLSLALYFLPSIEAKLNNHHSITSIFLVNLFLGWTLVGWVVAIAWAHNKPSEKKSDPSDWKTCPHCAELVRSAATKCKHCGSSLD